MEQIRGKTLLVVDDEDGPRQSLRIVFQQDYHVLLASNFDEAMKHARTHQVDVAILDIRMVGHSGIDVLKMLKSIDSSIEVIMLTAYETLETARQALRHGARDYIGKPFDVETLRQAVYKAFIHNRISRRISQAEDQLGEITGQLEEVRAQEDMARKMNQFYAGILHDINNPLSVIQCFVDLLLEQLNDARELGPDKVAVLREKITTISRQMGILADIATRHLDFLRKPASKENASPVNEVLHDLRELMNVHPLVRKGDIRVVPLENEARAMMNTAELMQVLLNLIINAILNTNGRKPIEINAFQHTGSVKSEFAEGADLLLHEDVFAPDLPHISLSVTDQAGGIAPEVLPRIFDAHFTAREGEKGSGLGLSIVSSIVRNSKGAIRVVSKHGHGSTFTIYIPILYSTESDNHDPNKADVQSSHPTA